MTEVLKNQQSGDSTDLMTGVGEKKVPTLTPRPRPITRREADTSVKKEIKMTNQSFLELMRLMGEDIY